MLGSYASLRRDHVVNIPEMSLGNTIARYSAACFLIQGDMDELLPEAGWLHSYTVPLLDPHLANSPLMQIYCRTKLTQFRSLSKKCRNEETDANRSHVVKYNISN